MHWKRSQSYLRQPRNKNHYSHTPRITSSIEALAILQVKFFNYMTPAKLLNYRITLTLQNDTGTIVTFKSSKAAKSQAESDNFKDKVSGIKINGDNELINQTDK